MGEMSNSLTLPLNAYSVSLLDRGALFTFLFLFKLQRLEPYMKIENCGPMSLQY